MATFEDAGYFCVDNLPPEMIGSLAELFGHEGSKVERAAVASDVRGGEYFDGLVKRGRRPRGPRRALPAPLPGGRGGHADQPLQGDAPPASARRRRERRSRRSAPSARCWPRSRSVRTSRSTPATCPPSRLRKVVADKMLPPGGVGRLAVTFMTFGFKHGSPARRRPHLRRSLPPEPPLRAELRDLTGLDEAVIDYVERSKGIESSTTGSCRCSTTCCRRTSRRASRT